MCTACFPDVSCVRLRLLLYSLYVSLALCIVSEPDAPDRASSKIKKTGKKHERTKHNKFPSISKPTVLGRAHISRIPPIPNKSQLLFLHETKGRQHQKGQNQYLAHDRLNSSMPSSKGAFVVQRSTTGNTYHYFFYRNLLRAVPAKVPNTNVVLWWLWVILAYRRGVSNLHVGM